MTSASGRWVRYGTDAGGALRDAIAAAKGAEPLAPVTVVVPSNQVGVSARRLLASGALGSITGAGPGLIGVTFVTPYRLAELLGATALAAQGRRPVSTPVLGAAVRQALAADPGSFAPVAAHAATEAALVAAHRELRDLDDAALAVLSASSVRAREVVRLHRASRAILAEGWYDEEDLMAAAAGAVRLGQATAEVGAVIVHLPQRLTRHAAGLLATLGERSTLHVLAGATGVARADAEVTQAVGRLGVDLGPVPTDPQLAEVVAPARTRIVTASDADDEVRAAVRAVVDAVRAGTSLDRVAVLYAAREPYARLVDHHLDAAGVPTNGPGTLPLAGRVAGRALLGLLALPATGWRRHDVFAWLGGGPILRDGKPTPTSTWERASRDAGVVGGVRDWDVLLAHRAEVAAAEADQLASALEDPDGPGAWRVDRARQEAARCHALRSFVLGLAQRLAAAEAPVPWAERVAWAKALLTDLLGGPARRAEWPDVERRGAERLELALDRLAVLDDVEGPVPLDVFARALATELDGDLGRVGRFGEGVLVGPVSMGVGVDLSLVIVVGMAEGTFPSTLREDSLLPDEDREVVGGALPLRAGHVDRLHHQFLAVLGAAHRQVLCIPKGDLRRSRERVPSRWALDVASALAGETWWSDDLLVGSAPWLTHHASFDAAIRTASPATEQEHRLRQLLARAGPRSQLAEVAATVDPTLAAGVAVVDARASTRLTRFDGVVAGLAIPSPIERGASASSLERWAACPHGYLVHQVLGARPLEQPEDALQITALDRGELVHQALEQFVLDALAQGRVPPPGRRWADEDRARLAEIAGQLCDEAEAGGLVGRELFWRRDRAKILADLDRFLREDDGHRAATGALPVAAELAFGAGAELAVAFPLPDGRSVPLRGKADRVDRSSDGTLHVLDYKTGKPDRYRGLSADDPHQGGRHLQLAVYGVAARAHAGDPHAPVRADYWFTSTRGGFKKLGYHITDHVLAEVSTAMATIVEGIERGMFAPHPIEHTTSPFIECHACDPDGLGTTELHRQWQRKLADPALAPYLALVGPPLDEGEGAAP